MIAVGERFLEPEDSADVYNYLMKEYKKLPDDSYNPYLFSSRIEIRAVPTEDRVGIFASQDMAEGEVILQVPFTHYLTVDRIAQLHPEWLTQVQIALAQGLQANPAELFFIFFVARARSGLDGTANDGGVFKEVDYDLIADAFLPVSGAITMKDNQIATFPPWTQSVLMSLRMELMQTWERLLVSTNSADGRVFGITAEQFREAAAIVAAKSLGVTSTYEKNRVLGGTAILPIADALRHSTRPNCRREDADTGRYVRFITRKAVPAGEELTIMKYIAPEEAFARVGRYEPPIDAAFFTIPLPLPVVSQETDPHYHAKLEILKALNRTNVFVLNGHGVRSRELGLIRIMMADSDLYEQLNPYNKLAKLASKNLKKFYTILEDAWDSKNHEAVSRYVRESCQKALATLEAMKVDENDSDSVRRHAYAMRKDVMGLLRGCAKELPVASEEMFIKEEGDDGEEPVAVEEKKEF